MSLNEYIETNQFTAEELAKAKTFLEALVKKRKTKRSKGITVAFTPTELRYISKLSKLTALSKCELLRRLIFSIHPSYIAFLKKLYKESDKTNAAIQQVLEREDGEALLPLLQRLEEINLSILAALEGHR